MRHGIVWQLEGPSAGRHPESIGKPNEQATYDLQGGRDYVRVARSLSLSGLRIVISDRRVGPDTLCFSFGIAFISEEFDTHALSEPAWNGRFLYCPAESLIPAEQPYFNGIDFRIGP